jgi:hypothetical protein
VVAFRKGAQEFDADGSSQTREVKIMNSDFQAVFAHLKRILAEHASSFVVSEDSPTRYCIEAPIGPATLKLWHGKKKRAMIPVAWTEIGKNYVSFHHMALYGNDKLRDGLSQELKSRMQGKTCFNFKNEEQLPFAELEALTARGNEGIRAAGFIQ